MVSKSNHQLKGTPLCVPNNLNIGGKNQEGTNISKNDCGEINQEGTNITKSDFGEINQGAQEFVIQSA